MLGVSVAGILGKYICISISFGGVVIFSYPINPKLVFVPKGSWTGLS